MICSGCRSDLGPPKSKKAKDAVRLGVKIMCELCAHELIEYGEGKRTKPKWHVDIM